MPRWRDEIFGVWVPWLAIMLAVAVILFSSYRVFERTRILLMKVAGVVTFLVMFAFGLYVVLTPGDRLTAVPIFLNGLLCLVYALLIVRGFFRKYKIVTRTP